MGMEAKQHLVKVGDHHDVVYSSFGQQHLVDERRELTEREKKKFFQTSLLANKGEIALQALGPPKQRE